MATGLYSMKKPMRFLRSREKKLVAATYCSVSALIIDMYETHLATNDYLAGAQFTAADIMNLFPFTRGQAFMPFDLSKRPAISRWIERLTARPAYQRAMAKAEPA